MDCNKTNLGIINHSYLFNVIKRNMKRKQGDMRFYYEFESSCRYLNRVLESTKSLLCVYES